MERQKAGTALPGTPDPNLSNRSEIIMGDLFEYLKWRGDIPFHQVPLTPVDALILSELSYLHLESIVPSTADHSLSLKETAAAFQRLPEKERVGRSKQDPKLLDACVNSIRFGNAGLTFFREVFVPEEETQFAAVTFLLDDGTAFLSFRGTDFSLMGWKEDFNMSFADSIPAQREALRYLRDFAGCNALPMRLGGHSKGGNVAVYAAAKAESEIQQRILNIYNNDGPGFTDILMGDPGYLAMVSKIQTYIPQSSIIGMLLEHEEPYTVVKSSLFSLLQHECYSWEIQGGDFVHVDEITDHSRFVDRTLKRYLAENSKEERSKFVDTVFSLLSSGGASQVFDLLHPKHIGAILKSLGSDEQSRNLLLEELQQLLHCAYEANQRKSAD
jgi:hypothetical protein